MIGPPDSHHLSAAVGWLELGNPDEAGREIARLSPETLDHPDALEVRWSICAAGRCWDAGLEIARLLLRKAPERVTGWVHTAYSMRRSTGGGLNQAWNVLRPAFEKFPDQSIIPYNLACYAAQMDRPDEAWDWLHKAIDAAGDIASIKTMALSDPDLEPLRDRIRQLESDESP